MVTDLKCYSNLKTVAEICRGARDVEGAIETLKAYRESLFRYDTTLIQLQRIDQISRQVYDQIESKEEIDGDLWELFGDVLFQAPEEGDDLYSNDWKKRP